MVVKKFNKGIVFLLLGGIFSIIKVIPTVILISSGYIAVGVMWFSIFGATSYFCKKFGEKMLSEPEEDEVKKK